MRSIEDDKTLFLEFLKWRVARRIESGRLTVADVERALHSKRMPPAESGCKGQNEKG